VLCQVNNHGVTPALSDSAGPARLDVAIIAVVDIPVNNFFNIF